MGDPLGEFISRKNLASFSEQLRFEIDPTKRATLVRLLIEEEDKLGFGYEQLAIVNEHIAAGHVCIQRQQVLLSELSHDQHAARQANTLLEALLHAQALYEHRRQRILDELDRRQI